MIDDYFTEKMEMKLAVKFFDRTGNFVCLRSAQLALIYDLLNFDIRKHILIEKFRLVEIRPYMLFYNLMFSLFCRNRLPMISDNLSHWSDIFLWRHHHYEAIINAYNAQHDQVS